MLLLTLYTIFYILNEIHLLLIYLMNQMLFLIFIIYQLVYYINLTYHLFYVTYDILHIHEIIIMHIISKLINHLHLYLLFLYMKISP